MQAAAAGSAVSGNALEEAPPPPGVLELIDPMEVNRMFVRSERLNSDAVVEFVRALCTGAPPPWESTRRGRSRPAHLCPSDVVPHLVEKPSVFVIGRHLRLVRVCA